MTSVDEYIAAQPEDVQPVLRRVRGIVRKAVPKAVEEISYGMPAFKVAGRTFLSLGGWKQHYSLYPASDALVAASKGALKRYRVGKGTLSFPLSEPVPVRLITLIAKFQARRVRERPSSPAAGS